MAKYIDAEKLKAEIKHLKLDVWDEAHQFDLGARSALSYIEQFLTSLQQEQQEEMLDKDLNEAAEEYADANYFTWLNYKGVECDDHYPLTEAYKAGAAFERERMLKDAVTVQVVGEQRDLRIIDSTERCLFNAERGDWLNIIILNEK